MTGAEQVFIDRCGHYLLEDIATFLDKVTGIFDSFSSLAGAKVLLKPNLISTRGEFSCTHPDMIVGVATWLINHGAHVSVGDSPAFGSAASVLAKLGLTSALSKLDIPVVEFKQGRSVTLASGAKIELAAELSDYDLLINIPKVKAHDQLFITMAVKNIFGVVKGLQKVKLHMSHGHSVDDFASVFLDLLPFLPPHVSIVDGIEVMHCHGPLNGESLALGVLAAGKNPVAVDTALLALLELDPIESPIHFLARTRKIPGSRLSELAFPILQPASFSDAGFMAPGKLDPVRFHPLRYFLSRVKRIVLNKRA